MPASESPALGYFLIVPPGVTLEGLDREQQTIKVREDDSSAQLADALIAVCRGVTIRHLTVDGSSRSNHLVAPCPASVCPCATSRLGGIRLFDNRLGNTQLPRNAGERSHVANMPNADVVEIVGNEIYNVGYPRSALLRLGRVLLHRQSAVTLDPGQAHQGG